jgi:biotin carboxyl carrier protein
MIQVIATHSGTIKKWCRSDTGRNRMTRANEKIAITSTLSGAGAAGQAEGAGPDGGRHSDASATGGIVLPHASNGSHAQESFVAAPVSGKVHKLFVAVGENFQTGDVLAEIEKCKHPALFNSLCVSCGDKVDSDNVRPVAASSSSSSTVSVAVSGHSSRNAGGSASGATNIPFYNKQLQLSASEAER